jgi:hypothetical protein
MKSPPDHGAARQPVPSQKSPPTVGAGRRHRHRSSAWWPGPGRSRGSTRRRPGAPGPHRHPGLPPNSSRGRGRALRLRSPAERQAREEPAEAPENDDVRDAGAPHDVGWRGLAAGRARNAMTQAPGQSSQARSRARTSPVTAPEPPINRRPTTPTTPPRRFPATPATRRSITMPKIPANGGIEASLPPPSVRIRTHS